MTAQKNFDRRRRDARAKYEAVLERVEDLGPWRVDPKPKRMPKGNAPIHKHLVGRHDQADHRRRDHKGLKREAPSRKKSLDERWEEEQRWYEENDNGDGTYGKERRPYVMDDKRGLEELSDQDRRSVSRYLKENDEVLVGWSDGKEHRGLKTFQIHAMSRAKVDSHLHNLNSNESRGQWKKVRVSDIPPPQSRVKKKVKPLSTDHFFAQSSNEDIPDKPKVYRTPDLPRRDADGVLRGKDKREFMQYQTGDDAVLSENKVDYKRSDIDSAIADAARRQERRNADQRMNSNVKMQNRNKNTSDKQQRGEFDGLASQYLKERDPQYDQHFKMRSHEMQAQRVKVPKVNDPDARYKQGDNPRYPPGTKIGGKNVGGRFKPVSRAKEKYDSLSRRQKLALAAAGGLALAGGTTYALRRAGVRNAPQKVASNVALGVATTAAAEGVDQLQEASTGKDKQKSPIATNASPVGAANAMMGALATGAVAAQEAHERKKAERATNLSEKKDPDKPTDQDEAKRDAEVEAKAEVQAEISNERRAEIMEALDTYVSQSESIIARRDPILADRIGVHAQEIIVQMPGPATARRTQQLVKEAVRRTNPTLNPRNDDWKDPYEVEEALRNLKQSKSISKYQRASRG